MRSLEAFSGGYYSFEHTLLTVIVAVFGNKNLGLELYSPV